MFGDFPSMESMVSAEFCGMKSFLSSKGYPANDGYCWKTLSRKAKGAIRYHCMSCKMATKKKFQTKNKTRQKRGKIQFEPMEILYEVAHGAVCKPLISNICHNAFMKV